MTDCETTACQLLDSLISRHLSIATAESCTGGNIAHTLTLIPGSSEAVKGGVVAYCNEVKHKVLGVSRESLDTYGAVSIPVVEQMATGACRVCNADIAVATSGIAGPGGGSAQKPVGTVCIAAASASGAIISNTFHFSGRRADIIDAATATALHLASELISTLKI